MASRPRHLTAAIAAIVGAASLTAAGVAAGPDAASSRHYDPIALADVTGAYGLRDLDDRVWTTDALRDRVVLVDAWATWCAPCLAELPRLRALAAAHPDRLVILGLSLDTMPRHAFVGWLRRHDITWPQVFDGRGYGGAVATRIGIDTLPASRCSPPAGGRRV
jgi:thiol-disulfide isomerase/thioredoxin